MEISIIIPAYNEEARIGTTISSILSYMSSQGHQFEVIVVDDGSSDTTLSVAQAFHNPHIRTVSIGGNRGKGFAVWKGLSKARYDLALVTDADLSTPIEDLQKLTAHRKEFDVVIGSRNMPDSSITVPQPWLRSRLGKTFPLLARLIALPGIMDSQCGFKLFTRKAINLIVRFQTINGFGFDVEQLHICRKAGIPLKEVGVHWANAPGSKVRIMRDPWLMFCDLLLVRINDIRGRYPVRANDQTTEPTIPSHGGHF